MKTITTLALLAALTFTGTGCSILSHNTPADAATTIRVHVGEGGRDYAISIAKDTSFQKLDFTFGDIHLRAASITGSASGPLAVAADANAKSGKAIADVTKATGEAVGDAAKGVADAVKKTVVK